MVDFHQKGCHTCESNLIEYGDKRTWNQKGKDKKRELVNVSNDINNELKVTIKRMNPEKIEAVALEKNIIMYRNDTFTMKRKKPNLIFIPVKRLCVTYVLGNIDKQGLKHNPSYLTKYIYKDGKYGNQREERVKVIEGDIFRQASYFFKSCKDEEDFNDIEVIKRLTKSNEISKYKKQQQSVLRTYRMVQDGRLTQKLHGHKHDKPSKLQPHQRKVSYSQLNISLKPQQQRVLLNRNIDGIEKITEDSDNKIIHSYSNQFYVNNSKLIQVDKLVQSADKTIIENPSISGGISEYINITTMQQISSLIPQRQKQSKFSLLSNLNTGKLFRTYVPSHHERLLERNTSSLYTFNVSTTVPRTSTIQTMETYAN